MEKISLMVAYFNKKPAEQLTTLFRRLFPVCELCSEPGLQVILPAPGIVLQLCGPASYAPAFLTDAPQPVISYAVIDLEEMVNLAVEKGASVLQQTTDECTGLAGCYLRFPDGQVLGFFTAKNGKTI